MQDTYACKASGRKTESFLLNSTVIDVLHGELVAVDDYAEMLELLDRITQCNGHKKEIAELHKQITSMAKSMTSELRNHGQPINEVSAWQARRKLSKFQANVKDVLWWAESFGLTPTELKCVTSHKVAITLQLQDSALTTNSESEEKEKLLQVREMYCYTVFKNKY